MARQIILIVHNLRSAHNVGSILRTAEGLAVDEVILSGYSPYPINSSDQRLPHIAKRVDTKIRKTSLGAESTQHWRYQKDIKELLRTVHLQGYELTALEQSPRAINLTSYRPPEKLAIVIGNEVAGVEPEILKICPIHIQIPMLGHKESFNVVQASAMALFYLRHVI